LIDYKSYAESKGISYSCFSSHAISISVIEEIAKIQNVSFQQADILIVRTGFTEELDGKTAAEQTTAMMTGTPPGCCGVESTEAAAAWFWDHHFAAVGGDAIAFEAIDFTTLSEGLGEFIITCIYTLQG
jgi:kynurenine formamidase